ncbi:hypothetical protein BBP40_006685 [Aspergillus hancockii]|nr:hypothetical protein BBP40_006685 [Aspergillus hancockii]
MYVSAILAAASAHWVVVIVSFAISYIACSVIYNLYFSPLAKYPGPFFAKISSLPDFYWALTGDRHMWIARNHEIYGDVLRFRPDGLLFKTPQAYQDIFNAKANVKRSKFYNMLTRNKHDLSTITDTKEPGENEYRKIPHAIASLLQILYPLGHSPWLNILVWLKPRGLDWVFGVMTPTHIQFLYDFVKQSLGQRLRLEEARAAQRYEAGNEGRGDMLHYLLSAKDPETGLPGYTLEALEAEALMLTIAGSDTTSVIMAGFFFYIVRTPRAYRRLVNEIRDSFASADEIRGGPKLTSCLYLRACVEEAMRITPAGPAELPRVVLPGGIMVDGAYISEGITVGVAHWSFYRNEESFPDPNVYRPERWIVDEESGITAEDVARARSSCFPFTAGTTSCAGKNFALLELYMVIARTLWLYDIRLLPGDRTGAGNKAKGWGKRNPNVLHVADSYISIRDGPMIQFKKRKA